MRTLFQYNVHIHTYVRVSYSREHELLCRKIFNCANRQLIALNQVKTTIAE